ncbi:hypothetical protein GOODEAATRI_032450 [Goodea atripinnis]|uniref:Fibronectin type-III domain-containing protein n=1 Tax=Goodea atripinnis TaxID=208336 RepID=A0ABV0PJ04_9TELE
MGHPDRSVVILSTTLSSVYRFSFCGPVLVDLDPFRLETSPKAATGANTKHLHEENSTSYRRGCVNTTALQCDLTSFNISVYGIYRAKVQALLGAETSDWVESNQTTLDKDSESVFTPRPEKSSLTSVYDLKQKDGWCTLLSLSNNQISLVIAISFTL